MAFHGDAIRGLYPFESRYFDRDGVRMHYLDEGSGAPVVMVHGNPTWSFYYRGLVAALRDGYRCIVPDHVGCGLSDKPGDGAYEYVMERRVDDLAALLAHLGVEENVTLVLHDWGGMIGAAWALRRPERIGRLVVLNTAAFLMPAGKRLPWRLRAIRRGPLGPILVRGLNGFARGAAWMAAVRRLPPEVRAAYTAPYDSWANRIATLRFVQDIPLGPGDRSYAAARSVDENLCRLAGVPVLICWGERDFVFDRDYLAQWRRRFPNAEAHSFADAGHYVLEDAGERVVPLVVAFLARHPAR